jgi:hypothetical protein
MPHSEVAYPDFDWEQSQAIALASQSLIEPEDQTLDSSKLVRG